MKNKKILFRADFNVPIKENKILETERIDILIPEIKNLLKNNFLTILSHLGKGEEKDNLKIVEIYLRKKLNKQENKNLQILENTRWQKGEKSDIKSPEYLETSKYFSKFGEIFINDAFSVCHRNDASIVGITKIFKKERKKIFMGELMKKEILNLNKFLKNLKNKNSQTLAILSGAKISSKLPLIEKFLKMKSKIFIGGAMANQIYKDVLNKNIGSSFYEKDFILNQKLKDLLLKNLKNKNILLNIDFLNQKQEVNILENIQKDENILDIGPATLYILKKEIEKSKNIILNGPVGKYEDGFSLGSINILKELNKMNNKNILIGGGDTLSMVKKIKILNKKNLYISTSGGAMLEYILKNGKLPGIDALK